MNDFDETLRDRLATLAQEAVPDADAQVDADLANVEWIQPRRHARGNATRALLVAAIVLLIVGSIAGVVAVKRGGNSPDVAAVTETTVTPTTVPTTPTTTP